TRQVEHPVRRYERSYLAVRLAQQTLQRLDIPFHCFVQRRPEQQVEAAAVTGMVAVNLNTTEAFAVEVDHEPLEPLVFALDLCGQQQPVKLTRMEIGNGGNNPGAMPRNLPHTGCENPCKLVPDHG